MRLLRSITVLAVLFALALPARALPSPHLSVTRTLLDPGQATTASTTLYGDAIEKHLAELRVQAGLTVTTPERDVFLDGARGRVLEWRVTAAKRLRPGRYWLTLFVDGWPVDMIAIDVRPSCCWVWLSRVTKSP